MCGVWCAVCIVFVVRQPNPHPHPHPHPHPSNSTPHLTLLPYTPLPSSTPYPPHPSPPLHPLPATGRDGGPLEEGGGAQDGTAERVRARLLCRLRGWESRPQDGRAGTNTHTHAHAHTNVVSHTLSRACPFFPYGTRPCFPHASPMLPPCFNPISSTRDVVSSL